MSFDLWQILTELGQACLDIWAECIEFWAISRQIHPLEIGFGNFALAQILREYC